MMRYLKLAAISLSLVLLTTVQAREAWAVGLTQTDTIADDPIISAAAAHELVGRAGVVFIHVGRDAEAFADAHIEGARFLPLAAFTEERNGVPFDLPSKERLRKTFGAHGLSADQRVVIYSDPSKGDIDVLAAARAFFTLEAVGHGRAQLLDGGLDAWRNAGLPLTKGEGNPVPATEYGDAEARRQVVVDAHAVHDRLEDASMFLVDARPAAEYTGESNGAAVERAGHIPGAVNLFWKDYLRDDGTLKPTEELAAMWIDAGVTRNHDVVVYCRTGMQASYAYLVARLLGLSPQMYDASYLDWSNNTEYPVTRFSH